MQQYVQDHDGRFPDDRWNIQVLPYMRTTSFVRCPTRRALALEREELEATNPMFFPDYLYNTAKLSRIHHTAKGNVWFDGEHEAAVVNVAATFMHADEPFEFYTARGNSSCGVGLLASTLHSGGANYSFVDGHVKWLSPNGISRLQCE